MKKRLLVLIGVIVVLASALIIPVGAETNDQVTCSPLSFNLSADLRGVYAWSSFLFIDGPVLVSGKMSSSATVSPGENFNYTVDNIRFTVDSNGYMRAYFYVPGSSLNTSIAFTQNGPSRFSVRPLVDSSSTGVVESISFSYSLSDVVSFIPFLCDSWGFSYPAVVSQDELDQARQEGYQEGYQEGIQSDVGYQEGYDAGVEAGRQEGYQEGVTDGLQQAADMFDSFNVRPIWDFAQLRMIIDVKQVSGGTNRVTLDNVPFTVSDNGTVSFERSIDYLASYLGVDVPLTDVSIHQISFIWASDLGIGNLWDWFPQSPIYTSVSFYSYPAFTCRYERFTTAEYDDTRYGAPTFQIYNNRSAFVTDPTYPYDDIRKISFDFNVFTDTVSMLRTMTFTTDLKISAEGYNAGYVAGYADGTAVVAGPLVDEAYDRGYGTGYVLGFSNGKKEGLQISETGDWKQLMLAVVEAPINTFQSLFNFEVLGLDMRAAFGSMMALCVLLVILKKVL